jgi:hypothetical protein
MSAVQIPKIELACDDLTILKQQFSVSAYLQEIEIRKALRKLLVKV